MPDNITTDEKIDYIYTRLKKEERNQKLQFSGRWLFRIVIVIFLIYFYKVTIPNTIDNTIDKMKPNIDFQDSDTINNIKDYINTNF